MNIQLALKINNDEEENQLKSFITIGCTYLVATLGAKNFNEKNFGETNFDEKNFGENFPPNFFLTKISHLCIQ